MNSITITTIRAKANQNIRRITNGIMLIHEELIVYDNFHKAPFEINIFSTVCTNKLSLKDFFRSGKIIVSYAYTIDS